MTMRRLRRSCVSLLGAVVLVGVSACGSDVLELRAWPPAPLALSPWGEALILEVGENRCQSLYWFAGGALTQLPTAAGQSTWGWLGPGELYRVGEGRREIVWLSVSTPYREAKLALPEGPIEAFSSVQTDGRGASLLSGRAAQAQAGAMQ